MTAEESASFEWLRAALDALPHAPHAEARDLIWADPRHTLAVARDIHGAIEVFVVGRPLKATTAVLAATLKHQAWATATGDALEANRLILPEQANFPGVAAFVCAELLANGLLGDAQTAFTRTEPVIAALFQRESVSNQVLTGLAGELLLVDALTRGDGDPATIVNSWYGSVPSSRDLQLGAVGVEVKATTGSSSTHSVQGLHQVELGLSVDDEPEADLYMLSVGLRWLPTEAEGGTSIPRLVNDIAARLDTESQAKFLARLRQYGGDAGIGYDHARDRSDPRFARRVMAVFERLYDMTDERIRVLRSASVDSLTNVDPSSISFRVVLPRQVNGEINPIVGIERIAHHLAERAGLH